MWSLIYLLFFALISLVSCSDNNCTLDDWQGTYVGTKTCESGFHTDLTFSISINTTFPEIPPKSITLDGTSLLVDNCSITGAVAAPGFLPLFFAHGELNGNKINVTLEFNTGTCSWEGKKQ
jgi:hypothetical protein